jgi:hypothetical protein
MPLQEVESVRVDRTSKNGIINPFIPTFFILKARHSDIQKLQDLKQPFTEQELAEIS